MHNADRKHWKKSGGPDDDGKYLTDYMKHKKEKGFLM